MERYNQLYNDLLLLKGMKDEFKDDPEMLEYIEYKICVIEAELVSIDNAWFNDEI